MKFAVVLLALAVFSGFAMAQAGDCSLCEMVVGFAERWVAENATEVEIEQYLEVVCALLPESDKTMCDQMVDGELPAIISYLEQEYPPQAVCQMVSLCAASEAPAAVSRPHNVGTGECSLCEFVMGYVEGYLAENQTEAQIEKEMDALCALGPSSFASQCDAFVQQYLPMMIQFIESNEQPAQFCAEVGLCTSSSSAVRDVRSRVKFEVAIHSQ